MVDDGEPIQGVVACPSGASGREIVRAFLVVHSWAKQNKNAAYLHFHGAGQSAQDSYGVSLSGVRGLDLYLKLWLTAMAHLAVETWFGVGSESVPWITRGLRLVSLETHNLLGLKYAVVER